MNQALGSRPLLIVLSGPTAVGKTELSIELATSLNAEIISADSRQIYKELEIGVAKPTTKELNQVPHHFINHVSIEEKYSAGKYEREVLSFLNTYFQSNPIAIMVGGTGFYIQSVLEGLDSFPKISKKIKKSVDQDLKEKGLIFLQKELKSRDPESYSILDIENPRRIVRAIEVIRESGMQFSEFKKRQTEQRNFHYLKLLLERDREELYERINERVDKMVQRGLEEEARNLKEKSGLPSLHTVGYQEWFDYFEGKTDRSTAIQKIKQHTRNYAKRQLTWFRNKKGWHRFPADRRKEIVSYVLEHPLVKAAQEHFPGDDQ